MYTQPKALIKPKLYLSCSPGEVRPGGLRVGAPSLTYSKVRDTPHLIGCHIVETAEPATVEPAHGEGARLLVVLFDAPARITLPMLARDHLLGQG